MGKIGHSTNSIQGSEMKRKVTPKRDGKGKDPKGSPSRKEFRPQVVVDPEHWAKMEGYSEQ